ncbi:MAG: radical SAM protein [Planctomycetia bacterium]|nr:radical SAM protein [Planctomycetia bacterium]
MKTFCIFTLGCKVNQYESEEISQFLQQMGYSLFPKKNAAHSKTHTHNSDPPTAILDLCIINSCAVTAEAEAKTRKLVRHVIKKYTPREMIVFGCAATHHPDIFRKIPGVTHVITAEETGGNRVTAVIQAIFENKNTSVSETKNEHSKNSSPEKWQKKWQDIQKKHGLTGFGTRHRAYIKIQDGCKQFCTYCIVPHLRKTLSSVPLEEVLQEATSLLSRGYRELVLTGIHLGYYGQNIRSRTITDWNASAFLPENNHHDHSINLTSVLHALVNIKLSPAPLSSSNFICPNSFSADSSSPIFDGKFRVRISSLEAYEASDALLSTINEYQDKICPHLHLSMQSGSESVLRRMNRPRSAAQYLERCIAAQEIIKNIALTTDVIVGFPGETEKEFLETCEIIEKIGFSKIHIFRYSPRPGTPASMMEGQISEAEKQKRANFLAKLEFRSREKYFQNLLGTKQEVLVEECRQISSDKENACTSDASGKKIFLLRGTSERYIPVEIFSEKDFSGHFAHVIAQQLLPENKGFLGKII